MRQEYLSPGLFAFYRDPLLLSKGTWQYLWDDSGKRYLDGFAGIVTVSVGHCHPQIVAKVQEQVATLQHTTTLYLHPTAPLFAKALAEHMPEGSGLTVTSFTNSGSEANELAILMARERTGHAEVISLRNGYHGGTQGAMALTAVGTWKFPSNPVVDIKHATPGYCYRCPFGLTYPSCNVKCAQDVAEMIRYETSGEIAAFIGEPIQGVGGVVMPPAEYFGIVYDAVHQAGGLCIADEVQTGFGRTGEHFWGFENWGVTARPRHDGQRDRQRSSSRGLHDAPRDRLGNEETGFTSTPSEPIQSRWPRGWPLSKSSTPRTSRAMPGGSAAISSHACWSYRSGIP